MLNKRERFTGPFTGNTCHWSNSKLLRKRSIISGSASASISSRTASPLRRLCNSVRTDSSRFRDSSSARYKLLFRVTRNAADDTKSYPWYILAAWYATRSARNMKSSVSSDGRRTRRGSARGTVTTPVYVREERLRRRKRNATLNALLITRGNG